MIAICFGGNRARSWCSTTATRTCCCWRSPTASPTSTAPTRSASTRPPRRPTAPWRSTIRPETSSASLTPTPRMSPLPMLYKQRSCHFLTQRMALSPSGHKDSGLLAPKPLYAALFNKTMRAKSSIKVFLTTYIVGVSRHFVLGN